MDNYLFKTYVQKNEFEVSKEDIKKWNKWFFDQFGAILKIKDWRNMSEEGIEIGTEVWNTILDTLEWFRQAFVISKRKTELETECRPMFELMNKYLDAIGLEEKKNVALEMQELLEKELQK